MKARVVHLIDTGGPGGAETVFLTLAAKFDSTEWQSIPVVGRSGWLADTISARGQQPVVIAPTNNRFDIRYLVRLVRLLRRSQADLIHAHLLGASLYGSLAARLSGIPAIATFHGAVDVSVEEPFEILKFMLLRQNLSRMVFVSESLRKSFLNRLHIRPDMTTVIPNGIDVGRFSADWSGDDLRSRLGIREDAILVGALGNIRPAKNYSLLLEAAALLSKDSAPYRFVVVGEGHGQLLNQLTSLRSQLGLEDRVIFAGFREDVERVLSTFDIFVLTSTSEGFSLSTVQALASGLPVVATKCGGPEEIITDGVHGFLVESNNPEAVANGIRRLSANCEEAKRMAHNGRQLVAQQYSVSRMIERYRALYCAVLTGD